MTEVGLHASAGVRFGPGVEKRPQNLSLNMLKIQEASGMDLAFTTLEIP